MPSSPILGWTGYDDELDFVLDVQLCRANMSRTPVIPHIWRRTAMCQANRSLKIPRLHLLNRSVHQMLNKLFGSTYQAVHFGVGNVVGLLGSYLKWTNKMSALFSHVLIWGSDSIITLTHLSTDDNHSDFLLGSTKILYLYFRKFCICAS